MRINQNIMANNAYRNLSTTNMSLGKSLEKLSSGFRINRAADDAAGLVISQNLRAQTSGLRQATRNAQDGISVVQTAEGALNEVHTMLNRMRDLSVQASNSGANDSASRSAAQSEANELRSEITRISASTSFGGTKLLDGTYGVTSAFDSGAATGVTAAAATATAVVTDAFTIQINSGSVIEVTAPAVGANIKEAADNLAKVTNAALTAAGSVYAGKVSVTTSAGTTTGNTVFKMEVAGLETGKGFALGASAVSGATDGLARFGIVAGGATNALGVGGQFQIGANSTSQDTLNISITAVSASALGLDGIDLTTNTTSAITAIDAAIAKVSTQRGELGAKQNRFESMINNLQVTTENLVASESRIRDTDMASEMTNFTKNQILSQAGTAMLAQANQVPQSILSLLR